MPDLSEDRRWSMTPPVDELFYAGFEREVTLNTHVGQLSAKARADLLESYARLREASRAGTTSPKRKKKCVDKVSVVRGRVNGNTS